MKMKAYRPLQLAFNIYLVTLLISGFLGLYEPDSTTTKEVLELHNRGLRYGQNAASWIGKDYCVFKFPYCYYYYY